MRVRMNGAYFLFKIFFSIIFRTKWIFKSATRWRRIFFFSPFLNFYIIPLPLVFDLIEWPESVFTNFSQILKKLILDLDHTSISTNSLFSPTGPNYHFLAIKILINLSIKATNLDMLWNHWSLKTLEKIIDKLISGISQNVSQTYKELCASCLCSFKIDQNNFCHDVEGNNNNSKLEDERSRNVYLSSFEKNKGLAVLIQFLEETSYKRHRYLMMSGGQSIQMMDQNRQLFLGLIFDMFFLSLGFKMKIIITKPNLNPPFIPRQTSSRNTNRPHVYANCPTNPLLSIKQKNLTLYVK